MKNWFEKFLSSNDAEFRLLRTIVQGVLGVVVANLDVIVGSFSFNPSFKPMIAALVMAVLSPVMAMIGKSEEIKHESD